MKRCFDSNTQIVVSILQSTNCLPTDFNFLCFCWLPPCGIFNNYTRIVACGTNEGSILILGEDKHDTGLKYLAVMPGHSTPITDIIISVDNFVFLSVSKDSTVCGWSCLDCSCIFKHKLQLNYGDYYFSLCKTMINYIWLYNYGESLYLIDLKNGEIIKHKHFPGIRSFSVISPNTGLTKEDIAVCIGILRITIYKITDDFEFIEVLSKDTDLLKHECTKVCDLGIIKIRNRHWKILEPTKDFKVLYKGTFSDLPADDYINTIEFDHNLTFFAAGSFQSRFFIVNLKKAFPNSPKTIENSTYHYLHACDPKFYSNNDSIKNESFLFPFFGRFAVNSQHEIIYSSNYNKSSTIIYLSENSIHTLNNNKNPSKNKSKHRNQNKLKVCHSTDPQSSIVIYSKDKSIFVYSWAYQHISKTFCFDKKITAISERKINNNSLSQIIVGFQDGSIGFQLYDGDSPPVFKIALTSAIHSFIIPPISGSGQYLIVLGYDGSACVFLDDDILTSFSTPSKLNHPISKVCYTPKMLITFGFIDGSFLTYSFDKPYPLLLSLSPPEQSHLIWPPRDLPQVICPITTSTVQFQKSSIFYEIFNVPELYNKVRNMTVLSSEKPQNIRNAQKKIYSQYNKSCNFIFDLMEPSKETPKNRSFVIIGTNNVPTLFYYPFRFDGTQIWHASPFIGATYFVAWNLLLDIIKHENSLPASQEIREKLANFIPILLQFLYIPDLNVQKIACKSCAELSSYISYQLCQEFVSSFLSFIDTDSGYDSISELEEYEKFLLSILIPKFNNVLPFSYATELYHFLDEKTVESSEIATLAIYILIDGISAWSKHMDTHEEKVRFYANIIDATLRQSRSLFLDTRFAAVACSNISAFISAFPLLIANAANDLNNPSKAMKIVNVYTNVTLRNPSICGGYTSDLLAKTCIDYPQYSDEMIKTLELHATLFHFIKVLNDFIAIGLPSGEIKVYQSRKILFSEQIFREGSKIDFIEIGPDRKYGVAISQQDKCAKVFYLIEPVKKLFRKKSRLLSTLEIPVLKEDESYSVKWIDEQNCSVTTVNKK